MNDAPDRTVAWLDDYAALTNSAGYVPLSRTRIEIDGADRAAWLHNLCTNEIKKLAAGQGCEAFITTVQGKTLGHAFIFVEPETLILDTVAGQSEILLKHLDRYLVCEQVTLTDVSERGFETLLAGPRAAAVIAETFGGEAPVERFHHKEFVVDGKKVRVRRVEIVPESFLVETARADGPGLAALLRKAGVRECLPEALDARRIEQGFPLFGRDLTDKNLPQELARDAQAISFVKGCYLGQETVARIDALGHVNKLLVGIAFETDATPMPGTELIADGTAVGTITSASFSPRLGRPLALGYVRQALATPGAKLNSALGTVEVVRLPLS